MDSHYWLWISANHISTVVAAFNHSFINLFSFLEPCYLKLMIRKYMMLHFKTSISEDHCANILVLKRIRQQLSVDPRKNKTKQNPQKTLVLEPGNMVSA